MPRETPKKRATEVMKGISEKTRFLFKKGKKQKYKSAADARKKG
jgi:hypothetical protein